MDKPKLSEMLAYFIKEKKLKPAKVKPSAFYAHITVNKPKTAIDSRSR